jgi:peptide/nickel transport system substrate-binding protein
MVKISDGSTRLSMLEKGDADIVEINPKYMSQAQTLKNVNVSTNLVAQYNIVIFSHNIDTSNPFPGSTATSDFYDDIDLRKGIAYAYDYDKYVQVGLGGYGVRLNSFIVPGTEGYDPDIPLYPHDTGKAIEHFKKARNGTVWANGFTIYMISWEGWEEGIVGGEVFKDSIEAINPKFRVNHITLPWPTGVARMAKDQMESWAGIWMPRYWSGYDYAENVMYSTGNYGAFSNYYNPNVDQLINQLKSEFNATRRTEILHRLQWIFYEDCVGILQGQFPVFGAQRTWVQGRIHDPLTRYQHTYYTISKAY